MSNDDTLRVRCSDCGKVEMLPAPRGVLALPVPGWSFDSRHGWQCVDCDPLADLGERQEADEAHWHNYAFQCAVCDLDPTFTITRQGDVVVSWACLDHLAMVCLHLQREGEQTELVVTLFGQKR